MTAALSAASEVLATVMVIDAVLTTSRVASSTGAGPCSGGASGAPATVPSARREAGALSGVLPLWDGPGPEQPVRRPNVAMLAIANITELRFKLQEVRLM